MTRRTAALAALWLALAWGALAFGSVYGWAQWILAICVISAVIVTSRARSGAPTPSRVFLASLILPVLAGLVQLVPLSQETLTRWSPHTVDALRELDVAFAVGLRPAHALSLSPSDTWAALGLYAMFALLMISVANFLSVSRARTLITGITVLGAIVALAGVAQQAVFGHKVYGFWTPLMGTTPFGPFINKNHFAGWMLMAVPLTLGLSLDKIAHLFDDRDVTWRERFIWLSSREASQWMLPFAAVLLMTFALVLSLSRSGIVALAIGMLGFVWLSIRARLSRIRKVAVTSCLLLVICGAVAWAGVDRLADRFGELDNRTVSYREGAWADARRVAGLFPFTGTGLNTYGTSTLIFQQHDLARHYREAHSDYLQLAAEGGLLLGLPVLLCIVLFLREVRSSSGDDAERGFHWIRSGAIVGLAAIGLQEAVEFSLQMPGNAVLFAVVCGIAISRPPQRRAPSRS